MHHGKHTDTSATFPIHNAEREPPTQIPSVRLFELRCDARVLADELEDPHSLFEKVSAEARSSLLVEG